MTVEPREMSVPSSPRRSPHRPEPDWGRWLYLPLSILAWGAVLFALFVLAGHVAQTLLILAIAVLITYALTPAVNQLERVLPRWAAVTITYLVFAGALFGLIMLIVNSVAPEISSLTGRLSTLVATGQLVATINRLTGRLGIPTSTVSDVLNGVAGNARGLLGNVPSLVSGVFNLVVAIVVIIVLSLYFLVDAPRVSHWMRHHTPRTQRGRIIFFLETFNRVLGGYIRGQVTLAVLVGLLVGFGMALLFHLPYAVLLGVLAFVLEFIPFIGVFVSGAACVLIAIASGGLIKGLLVLAYFVIIHIIEGDVVGPRIVGPAVGVHPAIQLIALVAGAEVFGLWGALFAAPIAGLVSAIVVTFWAEYQRAHPEDFPEVERVRIGATDAPPGSDAENDKRDVHKRGLDGTRGIFFRRRPPRRI